MHYRKRLTHCADLYHVSFNDWGLKVVDSINTMLVMGLDANQSDQDHHQGVVVFSSELFVDANEGMAEEEMIESCYPHSGVLCPGADGSW